MGTLLLIGSGIGLVAGLMAFLITYEEYVRHFPEKKTPLRLALEAAVFTFFVILALSVATGFVLIRVYMRQ